MKHSSKLLFLGLFAISLVQMSCSKKNKENTTISKSDENSTAMDTVKVHIQETTYEDFQKLTSQNNDTVYINNYWASWCAPCLMELPTFDDLVGEYSDKKVKFSFVNLDNDGEVDENVPIAIDGYDEVAKNLYHVAPSDFAKYLKDISPDMSIPITEIKYNKQTSRILGMIDEDELKQTIEKNLTK